MALSMDTAREVVAALEELHSEAEREKIRKRLSPGEEVIGVRMRHLFDLSKANAHLPLDEVERLLDEPAYEPRLAAFCILDFKARRPRLEDEERRALCETYPPAFLAPRDSINRPLRWLLLRPVSLREVEALAILAGDAQWNDLRCISLDWNVG